MDSIAQRKYIDSILPGYHLNEIDTLGNKFAVIQVAATFKNGGVRGWLDYLNKNLNTDLGARYIKLKKTDSIAKQTVIVSFIIEPTGMISNVTAETKKGEDVHPKLIAEAIRVVAESPRWEPAQQESFELVNGRIPIEKIIEKKKNGFKKVLYRHIQNITFVVSK